jgi:hypothetical protein
MVFLMYPYIIVFSLTNHSHNEKDHLANPIDKRVNSIFVIINSIAL